MNIWFTSDTHFHHKNILKFQAEAGTRQGEDHVEMTELMIEVWNKKIQPGDTVYHLGDVSFAPTAESIEILKRLNGNLHLIQGNHDRVVTDSVEARKRWVSVKPYDSVKIAGETIVLFHYPIVEWDKMHYGAWHLYGHVHGKDMGLGDRRAMDVGIDARKDMSPWSFDEVREIMKNRPIFSHHS